MNSGIIGKILYFWIFMIGGLFFAKILGFAKDDKTLITFCIALAVVYIVYQVARYMGKKKRVQKEAAAKTPIRKGQSNKHKKR